MSKFDANFTEEIIEPDTEGSGVNIEDFVAYPPSHVYIFTPCRDIWVGPGVDACLPPVPVLTKAGRPKRDKNGKVVALRATRWLDQNQRVEGMTWCPGQPMLIKDRLVVHGGWIERKGVTCFNLYRPPRVQLGNAADAKPWIDHVYRIFGKEDGSHSIKSNGWRTGCSAPARRSITRWCWVASRGSARTACSSQSSARWVPGISTKCHRRTCSAGSTASPNRSFCGLTRAAISATSTASSLRPHKDIHRDTAGRGAGRRKAPARTLRVQRPRLHHHHQPQD